MQDEYIEIELEEEPIELCNLLKILNLAETGGHAKLLINEGYVGLNNEICTQKRKKIYAGDTIYFDGDTFLLTLAEGVTPTPRKAATPKPAQVNAKASAKKNKKDKHASQVDKNTGRKPISFG
ncbi:RNA-binding S4 domain-containing protein [Pseudoalteromonas sp. T1lg65]|uniref:RNA-binding S4 domain-containing protein n=1 Tax=Pseudoalteromonas sp. T1lg65 TaxID=2077101 RepID=UPI003F7A36FE